jgi:hypothetical protein
MLASFSLVLGFALLAWLAIWVFGWGFFRIFFWRWKGTALGRLLGILGFLVFAVSLYAVFKSDGKTVAWFYGLSFCIGTYFLGKEKGTIPEVSKHHFWIEVQCLVVFGLTFFWLGSFFMPGFGSEIRTVFTDHFYYGKLAALMVEKGLEVNSYDFFSALADQKTSQNPYHFFEIWMTALLSECFQISTLQAFELMVLPIFLSLSFLALLSIFESIKVRIRAWHGILVFGVLIFPGLDSHWLSGLIGKSIGLQYHILGLGNGKILPLMPFFFLAIALIFLGFHQAALIFLASCVFYSVSLVCLWLAVGSFLIFSIYRFRSQWLTQFGPGFFSALCLVFGFGLYYAVNQGDTQRTDDVILSFQWPQWIRFFKESVFQILIFSLLYFNAFFIFIWWIIKNRKSWKGPISQTGFWVLALVFSFFSGIGLWAFSPGLFDGFQFFWMPRTLLLPVLLVWLVVQAMDHLGKPAFVTFLILGLISFPTGWAQQSAFQERAHQKVNQDFLNALRIRLQEEKITLFGLLYHDKTMNASDHPFALRFFGLEPSLAKSNYLAFPLSIFEDSLLFKLKPLQPFLVQNPLIQYKMKNSSTQEILTTAQEKLKNEELVAGFVIENKMPFVFCQDRMAMNLQLRPWVIDSLENPQNQNIIYFLKSK